MMAYLLAIGWGKSILKMVGSVLYIGTKETRISMKLIRKEPTAEIQLINVRPDSDVNELESLIYSII